MRCRPPRPPPCSSSRLPADPAPAIVPRRPAGRRVTAPVPRRRPAKRRVTVPGAPPTACRAPRLSPPAPGRPALSGDEDDLAADVALGQALVGLPDLIQREDGRD